MNLFNCTLEILLLTYYWYNSRYERVWDRLSLVKLWPNWNRIKSLGLSEAISETLTRKWQAFSVRVPCVAYIPWTSIDGQVNFFCYAWKTICFI